MHYELYGVYSKTSGHNCLIGAYASMKKALAEKDNQIKGARFKGFYILEKPRKNSIPYGADIYDGNGVGIRAMLMAKTLKPCFWQSETEYKELNPFNIKTEA